MIRGKPTLILMLIGVLPFVAQPLGADQEEGWIKLFNGKDLTGWTTFFNPKNTEPTDKIFEAADGVLRCAGNVFGYAITDKEYENYILRLQWRWGAKVTKSRNSGVFVHVTGPNKIWPKAVEAQLAAGRAGEIWLVDGFKLTVDAARQDKKSTRHFFRTKEDVEKPVGEWNQYEITCKGADIRLAVNGAVVNEGTAAESSKGKILLQSEGAEIEFRNVELKPLK